ncbi:MAG: prolipoprotein diacylglyceryl transferase [Nitrospirae bacterium]|nr:prolipoprotein diacylglyceryl transferase [Nitrospirota bacterium]
MITFPNISPEIVRVGPFAVRWYGMMYLFGFASSYLLVRHQLNRLGERTLIDIDSLYSYLILGLLIGARLGYTVFYNFSFYFQHPLELFAVWHGGMSFHGGLIGSLFAGYLFCRKFKLGFWHTADLIIVTAPVGLAFGRLGNFINGELYGRTTDVAWAMVFPGGGPVPRHPSQLYELLLEGVVLFIILWSLKTRFRKPGVLTALFLMLYGVFRFIVEFFREPDEQLGFVLGMFTMGQLLCMSMLLVGVMILHFRRR